MTAYGTIVADPPWRYDYPGGPSHSSPWRISAEMRYPTMALEDIKAIDVRSMAAPGAHLYLWATNPLMEQAFEVARAWGFAPTTMLTWCKPGPGFGKGWRGNTEHLLVCRDDKRRPFESVATGTWYQAPRGEHSAKPEMFLDLVEQMSPGPFLEMFSRRARLGWDTWGNEALHGGSAATA